MDLLSNLVHDLTAPFSSPRGVATLALSVVGLVCVVAATFVRTMVPLRAFTMAGQAAFLASAVFAPNIFAVVVYGALMPVNAYRLAEIRRLARRIEHQADGDPLQALWLRPYMRSVRFAAGDVVFRQGDRATAFYLLVSGELELTEVSARLPVGQMFGEIGFFSADGRRTLTAQCLTECELLAIDESTFRQLFFQSPEFAFRISSLMTTRLSADIARLREQLALAQKG